MMRMEDCLRGRVISFQGERQRIEEREDVGVMLIFVVFWALELHGGIDNYIYEFIYGVREY